MLAICRIERRNKPGANADLVRNAAERLNVVGHDSSYEHNRNLAYGKQYVFDVNLVIE